MRVLRCIALVLPFAAEAIRMSEELGLQATREGECTTKQITDTTICGASTVVQSITDIAKCPPKRECKKVWGRSVCVNVPQLCTVNVQSANTCDVLDKCPVTVSASLAGAGQIGNLLDVNINADVVNVQVESGHSAARELINANLGLVMPALNQVADLGLMQVNKDVKLKVGGLKTQLIDKIKEQNIGRFFTVLNPVEANDALGRVLDRTWDTIQADVAPRTQLEKAARKLNWRKRLCHRNLRIRVEDGPTYLVENWTNAEIARKFDEETECDTVYSAQCAKGIIIKRKQCPFKKDEVKQYCLFGVGCWRRKYTVKSSSTKTTSIDGNDMEVDKEVFVDHVKSTWKLNGGESDTVTPLSNQDTRELEDLDDQINLKVAGFQKLIVEEMCSKAGAGSWFPFAGQFRRWRCKGIINTVCQLARWKGKLPMSGMDDLNIKLGLRKDFTVSFIPDWNGLENLVAETLMTVLSAQPLPMNAQVNKIVLALDGNGPNIEVLPESKVYVTIDLPLGDLKIPAI